MTAWAEAATSVHTVAAALLASGALSRRVLLGASDLARRNNVEQRVLHELHETTRVARYCLPRAAARRIQQHSWNTFRENRLQP